MHGWIENRIYRKYESEKDKLLIGGGSWTINLKEIYGKPVDKIEYQTAKGVYSIDFTKAQQVGFVRSFQGENKLVIPVKEWDFSLLKLTERDGIDAIHSCK